MTSISPANMWVFDNSSQCLDADLRVPGQFLKIASAFRVMRQRGGGLAEIRVEWMTFDRANALVRRGDFEIEARIVSRVARQAVEVSTTVWTVDARRP